MLRRLHDASSDVGAVIATLCVAVTACIYTAEVVARYFLNAPLNWSGDISSYLLCASAFLALPSVTRSNSHVAISYFLEQMSEARRHRYARTLQIITGLVCLFTAIYIGVEGVRLFENDIYTTQPTRIPKWPIALVACVGLASAALHLFFARDVSMQEEAGI